MGQLAVIDVDRADEQSHGLGILDRQMPESACSGDGDPFAGLRPGLLDPLVSRDAGADQRGCIHRGEAGRHMGDVVWICEEVLGKAAVPGIAAELGLGAHRLPPCQAILAMTTRRVEPGHSDPVALLYDRYARSDGDDQPDGLMARNEWERGLDRPVAMRGMEIGVAYTAGLGFDEDLARPGRRDVPFLKQQGFSKLLDYCGGHFACHEVTPLSQD